MSTYISPWKAPYDLFVKFHILSKEHPHVYVRNLIESIVLHLQDNPRAAKDKLQQARATASQINDKTVANGILDAVKIFERDYLAEAEIVCETYKLSRYDEHEIYHDIYAVAFEICTEYLVTWNQTGWWDHPRGMPELERPMRLTLERSADEDSYLFAFGSVKVKNFYRGLKNEVYDQTARIYRMKPTDDVAAVLAARIELLNKFISFVRARWPELTKHNEVIVAIAQHYYDLSPTLMTALLDITYEPFVALFFATLGANPDRDKCGVVYRMTVQEIRDFFTVNATLLGKVTVEFDPFIKRLQRQRGVFINAPMPDAIGQLVPHNMRFYQRPGLMFEDPQKKITRSHLLPDDDTCSAIMREWNAVHVDVPLPGMPGSLILAYITELFPKDRALIEAHHALFSKLAAFHALINSLKYASDIWIVNRSIRRLEETVSNILNDIRDGRSVRTLRDYVFKTYFAYGSNTALLLQALEEVGD